MKIECYNDVKDGVIIWPDVELNRFKEALRQFPDGTVKIVVTPHTGPRSNGHNSLYWKRCQLLADEVGTTKESIHKEMMERAGYSIDLDTSSDKNAWEFQELYKAQQDLVNFLNEDRDIDEHLILPGADH